MALSLSFTRLGYYTNVTRQINVAKNMQGYMTRFTF